MGKSCSIPKEISPYWSLKCHTVIFWWWWWGGGGVEHSQTTNKCKVLTKKHRCARRASSTNAVGKWGNPFKYSLNLISGYLSLNGSSYVPTVLSKFQRLIKMTKLLKDLKFKSNEFNLNFNGFKSSVILTSL